MIFFLFLWENEPELTDDKSEFYFLFFWKMQQNAAENLGKKYVERDCCVVNSCHLYVLICVYLFLGFVSMVELAVFFIFLLSLIPMKQLSLSQ